MNPKKYLKINRMNSEKNITGLMNYVKIIIQNGLIF